MIATAGAGTITVTSNSDSDTSSGDGTCTLREAIAVANSGSASADCAVIGGGDAEIKFDSSITNIVLNGTEMQISNNLTIDGGEGMTIGYGAGTAAANKSRIFSHTTGSLTLKNLVLQHGYTIANGGAIFSTSSLTIDSCSFVGNEVGGAGLIWWCCFYKL